MKKLFEMLTRVRDRWTASDLADAISDWASPWLSDDVDVKVEKVTVPSGDFQVLYIQGTVTVRDASDRALAEFLCSSGDRFRPDPFYSSKLEPETLRELCAALAAA